MGDHKSIHLKGSIIDTIMVTKAITLYIVNGRATKMETKEGLVKTITTKMVTEARAYRNSNNGYRRNNSNQPRNQNNNGYQQNYHNNNRPREPQLSNISNFITQDGTKFENKSQVPPNIQETCTEP